MIEKALAEKLEDYLIEAHRAMNQAAIVFDLAMSAEKMCNPNNIGQDNIAWSGGPYLSSPYGKKQIDREFPYIIRASIEAEMVARRSQILWGIKKNDNGGVLIDLPKIDGYRSEPYIAKMSIIEQFEIFKDAMKKINMPYNKKRAIINKDKIGELLVKKISGCADMRNKLAHLDNNLPPTMKEAVEYFYEIASLGAHLFEISMTK